MIAALSQGAKVDIKLLRECHVQDLTIDIAERPTKVLADAKPGPSDDVPDFMDGVTVGDIDADTRKEMNLPENTKGVVITQIDPDSPSASVGSGQQRGDIVLEINRESVTTAKEAVDLSEKTQSGKRKSSFACSRMGPRASLSWCGNTTAVRNCV